jgi:CRP-like cAMP-binding protein
VSSAVLEHLSSAGLSLAYPKEDIYFDQMPTRHLDSASTADRTQLLQRVDLLEPMTDAELEELASSMRRHTFTKDEVVLREGDQGSSMFLVVEGLLSVHSDHPIDGATRVGQAAPGEVIGEMSLLTGEPRSATALAVTEVIAYEITKEHFQQLLARRPEIADSISQIVARRRESTEGLLHAADADQLPAQPASLASQLLTRIRTFLGGGQLTGEAHSANAPHRFPEQ